MSRWLALVPMIIFCTVILLWALAKILRPIAEIYSAYQTGRRSPSTRQWAPRSSDHQNYGIPKPR